MTSGDAHTETPPDSEPWTTRRLLRWILDHLAAHDIESPRLVTEMLLAHVLECERMRLYMEVDRPASPNELAQLRDLVRRAAQHEPVQYLVGEGWFFGRPFRVSPTTLIPRPSTETLVQVVLAWTGQEGPDVTESDRTLQIAEIGTGTGCVAVSLAAQILRARIVATDMTPPTLDLARENARRHDVGDRVEFLSGSLFAPLDQWLETNSSGPFDILCSNPPYIPDHEWRDVPANVKRFEPEEALRGGADGLDLIRPLIVGAAARLKPGGLLAVEIADCQRDAVLGLVDQAPDLADPRVHKDGDGLWRVLTASGAAGGDGNRARTEGIDDD